MGNFKIKSIWENKNTGGNVPAGLENRVQTLETKATTNETNITNLQQNAATKQYVNEKIQKRVIDANIPRANTYTIEPTPGYEIISVMAGRKRNEGYYFFTYQSTLNFQLFLHTDGKYKIYTEGAVANFGPEYKIIVVEMKV